MPLPPGLRALDADLPACPRALVDVLALQRDESASTDAMARVIESDMGLAVAVVRTVNSAMFGLLRRVQTVGEAVRYLGMREVTAITLDSALRQAFTPTPAIEAVWAHASLAGLLMGRSAAALGLDAMTAHSLGLFAHSGQAVLLARLPVDYGALQAAAGSDRRALRQAELAAYGICHAGLGSALCAAWGFAPDVVKCVREQLREPAAWAALDAPLRRLLGLLVWVDGLIDEKHASAAPADADADALFAAPTLAALAANLTPVCGLRSDALADALRGPWQQLHRAG